MDRAVALDAEFLNATKDEARARKKRVDDDTAIAGGCSWVPWVLTCGMCCGAFKDDEAVAKWQELCPRRCPTPAERFAT